MERADGGQVLESETDQLLEQAIGLTQFQLTQLAVAAGDAKSGQEILEVLNDQPREKPVTHGRLYPNLDTLVEKDLIDKGERDRRTHEYPTTEKGQKLLKSYGNWLEATIDTDIEPNLGRTAADRTALEHTADLTSFQFTALALLDGEKVSGQTVKEWLEDVYGCEINHGRLYPNLDTLVNRDLVEKGQLDRRTNYYRVLDAGRNVLIGRLHFLFEQGAVSVNGGGA